MLQTDCNEIGWLILCALRIRRFSSTQETKMIGQTISHYPALPRLFFNKMESRTVGAQRDKIIAKLGEGLPFVLLI